MANNTVAWTLSATDKTRDAFNSVKSRLIGIESQFVKLGSIVGLAFGAQEILGTLVSYDKLR